jgi:hypothetical protein
LKPKLIIQQQQIQHQAQLEENSGTPPSSSKNPSGTTIYTRGSREKFFVDNNSPPKNSPLARHSSSNLVKQSNSALLSNSNITHEEKMQYDFFPIVM